MIKGLIGLGMLRPTLAGRATRAEFDFSLA
jgi:hypothetical protein